MAIAYQYDASGYFVDEVDDYGFLPNNATYTAPAFQEGFIPRWNGTKWIQVENHTGKEGYLNDEPFTIKEYGPLPDGWSETPPPPTFSEVHSTKYAEIIGGADAVKAALSSRYSRIEEETWPQQEAGARLILGLEAECKNETARAILNNATACTLADSLVEKLAEADGTDKKTFARRIIENADIAYLAGIKTLLEQRALEAQLSAVAYNDSMTDEEKQSAIEQVVAIEVVYSVMEN